MLKRHVRSRNTTGPRNSGRGLQRRRLLAEALEDRRMLATWTGAVSNLWSDPGNWSGGVPNGTGAVAEFPQSGSVNVNTPVTVGRIEISASTGNLFIHGGNAITMDASTGNARINFLTNNVHGISAPLILQDELEFGGTGGNANVGSSISGNHGIHKVDGGRVRLHGDNTYTGLTTIVAGSFSAERNSALGSTSAGTVVYAGGHLQSFSNQATPKDIPEPITLDGGRLSSGGFALAATEITYSGSITVTANSSIVMDNSDGTMHLTGDMTGVGDVQLSAGGSAWLRLSGSNSITGDTSIGNANAGGTVVIDSAAAISSASNYTVHRTLDLAGHTTTMGSLAGGGSVRLGGATLTLSAASGSSSFSGDISGAGNLAKVGPGTQVLSGLNTYAGTTEILAGVLQVDGMLSSTGYPVTVLDGATLSGTGQIERPVIVADGGAIAPGTSTGVLSTGDTTFLSGSTFDVEVSGTTAGAGHDQLSVSGAADIGTNVELRLDTAALIGSTLADGIEIRIIDNDGAEAVTGTFAGLPEGAEVVASLDGLFAFDISYTGGDGNDVVLIARELNTPPEADAGGPYTIDEGAGVMLDASASTDAQNNIVSYAWDLDDDGQFDDAVGVSPSISSGTLAALGLGDDGTYPIAALVTDSFGASDIAASTITVNNVAPQLQNLSVTTPIDENDFATLSGDIIDPGTQDTFTLVVEWGDGSQVETFNYPVGTTSFSETHQYLDDNPSGTPSALYEVTIVHFADDDGGNAAGLAGTDQIETISTWDGSQAIQPFGESNTATYGQTFSVANAATTLSGFTYFIDDFQHPGLVDFEAFVMEWDGAKATGPVLFQSTPMSTTNNNGSDGFERIEINTGGVPLDAGKEYVAFLSASNLFDGQLGTSKWGATTGSAYADGSFVFMNNGANFSMLTSQNWNNWQNFDLAFEMDFGVPSAFVLPVTVNNVAPVVAALDLSDAVIEENGSVMVNGTFTDPGTLDTHDVVIDWGDGSTNTVINLTVGERTFSATHQYLDDNTTGSSSDTYTISATVTDDDTGVGAAFTSIQVDNVAPTITMFQNDSPFCGGADENEVVTATLDFTDPGTLDTHEVIVDWGDGSSDTVQLTGGQRMLAPTHVYATGGVFNVTVSVEDDDTGIDLGSTTVVVTGVGVVGNTLYVVGTDGDDQVSINQTGNGTIKVHADFLADSGPRNIPATGVEQIYVILCGGNDHASVAGNITLPAIIDGGDGDDHLIAGGGGAVLLGGNGNDRLVAGFGNDILIGGAGRDRLNGGPGEDFMAGGRSSYESDSSTQTLADDAALLGFLQEWGSADSRTARELALDDLVNSLTADGDEDKLTGASGDDWFFADQEDLVTDLIANGNGGGNGRGRGN